MISRLLSILLIASMGNVSTAEPSLRAAGNRQSTETGNCPIEEPSSGGPCKKYDLGPNQGCSYSHTVTGCLVEELACSPTTEYFCQSNKWEVVAYLYPACIVEGAPVGSCDPDTFQHGLCPSKSPDSGADCSTTGPIDDGCSYNYVEAGCESKPYCIATDTATCTDNDGDGTWQWEVVGIDLAPCPNPGGYCDGSVFVAQDGICPDTSPSGDCSKTGPINGGCPYNYVVTGCSEDDGSCTATDTAFCVYDETFGSWYWEIASIDIIDCPDGSTLPTGTCDGSTFVGFDGICPSTQPSYGTDCSTTGPIDGGCPYNYEVGGCSEDEAFCYAAQTASCNETDLQWQIATISVQQCPDESTVPTGTCDETTYVPPPKGKGNPNKKKNN